MEDIGIQTVGELRKVLEEYGDDIEIVWGVRGGEKDGDFIGDVENAADPRKVLILLYPESD